MQEKVARSIKATEIPGVLFGEVHYALGLWTFAIGGSVVGPIDYPTPPGDTHEEW